MKALLTVLLILFSITNSYAMDIPQTSWSIFFVDSEELVGEFAPATNAIDGDLDTFWHTEWLNNNPPHPHEIQINLGASYDINAFRYLPRQFGSNGRIRNYEFYVSVDGVNWGSPVASGTWTKNTSEKRVTFATKTGQFVRLIALSSFNSQPWTSLAELNVEGVSTSGNQAPDGVINSPSSDVTISVGDFVDFTGTGTDPDGNTPLSYFWNFGGGATNSTLEDPGQVQFNVAGTYNVSFTVTDSLGLSDQSPAQVTVTVNGAGSGIISQAGWSLLFVDSEELVGEFAPATNAFDGDANTIWHTEWLNNSPTHPHETQIDLGADYDMNEFRYLPRPSQQNGRVRNYEFYISSDGVNWGAPVVSGTFANTGSEKEVSFALTTGRYIRFVALSEVNSNPWTSMAELNVLGVMSGGGGGNLAPNGIIDSPTADVDINVGQSVIFEGTGTDPDGDIPLGYFWDFAGGAANSTLEDPGAIQFNSPGNFFVTFTVTDSKGLSDASPDSVQVNVTDGSDPTIPQSSWSLDFVTSEETIAEDNSAINGFDGDSNTLWHTEWSNGPDLPHEIQINLGSVYEIDTFRYFPRQFGTNGRILNYEFYVSNDSVNWGNAVASGNFADNKSEKSVSFPTATGQYVRLVSLSTRGSGDWTSMAELNIEGRCNTPFVKISRPLTDGVQMAPDLNVHASACLNSQIHNGWGVRFKLNCVGSSCEDMSTDTTSPYSAVFSNVVQSSNHTIEAVIVDDSGSEIVGANTSDTVTGIGSGDHYVAFGDSIVFGLGDDFAADDTSTDNRNTGGGYTPILNNNLTLALGYPHTVVNEG